MPSRPRRAATRRTPLAARRTPHAARRTPHAARRTPHAASRSPTARRRSPQDPILASTLNGAKFFAEKFVEMCGTDLTVDAPGNPFWHTGTNAPINSTLSELRFRRPQKFIYRVALGLSGGVGAPGRGLRGAKSWQRFVDSRIKDGRSQMYGCMKFDKHTG